MARRRGLPKDSRARGVIDDNVLGRQFRADAPDRKWVAGFTSLWTAGGWLYVAVVLDLDSRRAVGWSMRNSMTSQLVADALDDGRVAARASAGAGTSLGSGQPDHQRVLPAIAGHRIGSSPGRLGTR